MGSSRQGCVRVGVGRGGFSWINLLGLLFVVIGYYLLVLFKFICNYLPFIIFDSYPLYSLTTVLNIVQWIGIDADQFDITNLFSICCNSITYEST